jgi:NAD(P)-dependent dehydrogenase (short-subunit alcohol dehydrogenase family)
LLIGDVADEPLAGLAHAAARLEREPLSEVTYVASKGAVVSMAKGFARRFAPARITVNVIAPGQIDTPMQRSHHDEASRAAIAASGPMGRMGEPAEVAAVAVFLLSDHASFVSGATVNVSGGLSMY